MTRTKHTLDELDAEEVRELEHRLSAHTAYTGRNIDAECVELFVELAVQAVRVRRADLSEAA